MPCGSAFGNHARPAIRQLQPAATAMEPAFTALNELSPQFQGFFGQLQAVVDASEKGLPAFNKILKNLPPLLDDFQPFLKNANPMVRYIGDNKRDVISFFGNTVASSEAYDIGAKSNSGFGTLPGTDSNVRYLRTSQILNPQSLTFYPRQLGSSRNNAYAAPNTVLSGLKNGGSIFGSCPSGNVALPTDADPSTLVPLIQQFAFRTTDKDAVAAPACRAQGNYPGFSTAFPQLTAEP